jgi:hypothetical protein
LGKLFRRGQKVMCLNSGAHDGRTLAYGLAYNPSTVNKTYAAQRTHSVVP